MSRARPDPLEWMMLIFLALAGVNVVLNPASRPPSIVKVLSTPYLEGWCWLLVTGSAIGLLGCYWPTRRRGRLTTGLNLERMGMIMLAGVCVAYVLALIGSGPSGIYTGSTAAAFVSTVGGYAAYRARRIRRMLNYLTATGERDDTEG